MNLLFYLKLNSYIFKLAFPACNDLNTAIISEPGNKVRNTSYNVAIGKPLKGLDCTLYPVFIWGFMFSEDWAQGETFKKIGILFLIIHL